MSLHYSNENNKLREVACFVGVGIKVASKLQYEQVPGNVFRNAFLKFISEDL